MGHRNVHFSKHSGDGGTCAPKARLGTATPRVYLLSFICSLKFVCGLTHGGIALLDF